MAKGRDYSPERYAQLVDQLRDCIRLHVPPGSVVIVASRGDEDLVSLPGYRAWHFPQTDNGAYAGHHPANSADAIRHLRHLQRRGAQYLVFPWTSRWWLDHYTDFAAHLCGAHELRVSDEGVGLVFALREAPADEIGTLSGDDEHVAVEAVSVSAPQPIPLRAPAPNYAPRILTILARFGTVAYPEAEREIDEIFRRQLPSASRTVITVDNALPRSYVEERSGRILLGGDNTAREFSAFDRAVEFVGPEIWSYDLVHLATSAFNTLYVAYLERFDADVLAAVIGRPVCVGHIDCYNAPIDLLTFRSQHWMRSCFLFLPPAELKALGSVAAIIDGARFFTGDPAHPFRDAAPMSGNYRDYITAWLTGGDIGQGVEWHSRFELSRETLPGFEHKAVSILNEHLLAIRLRALGCRLIDVTWLSTRMRQYGLEDIPWATGWRDQLANRDDAALVLDARRVAVSAV